MEHAFDGWRGPGGSRWIAGEPGEQPLILAFDAPLTIRQVSWKSRNRMSPAHKNFWLAISCDGGLSYRELLRQEYNFSPPSTTCEREDWAVTAEGVTRLRLWIKPDEGAKPCRSTLS